MTTCSQGLLLSTFPAQVSFARRYRIEHTLYKLERCHNPLDYVPGTISLGPLRFLIDYSFPLIVSYHKLAFDRKLALRDAKPRPQSTATAILALEHRRAIFPLKRKTLRRRSLLFKKAYIH